MYYFNINMKMDIYLKLYIIYSRVTKMVLFKPVSEKSKRKKP